jgi:hypothetical protein
VGWRDAPDAVYRENTMTLIGWQNPADTLAHVEETGRWGHHRPGVHRIVGAVIWLAVVIYVLWLATRVVRAVERMADRGQGPK